MHRPIDEPVRPDPAGTPPDPGHDGPATPTPPRSTPPSSAPCCDRHGWQRRGGAAGRYGRWTPPGHRPAAAPACSCPRAAAFPDSEDLLGEALTALARSAAPVRPRGAGRPRRAQRRDPLVARRARRARPGAAAWTVAGAAARGRPRRCCSPARSPPAARAGYYGARHRRPAAGAPWTASSSGAAPGGRSLTAFVPVDHGPRRRRTALPGPVRRPRGRRLPARHRRHGGLRRAPSRPGSAAS